MTDLYRHNGSAPAPLPPIAYDADGNAFTAPYEPDDMAALGIVLAPTKPEDTETQTVEWDADAEHWVMVDRPPVPEPLPPPEPVMLPPSLYAAAQLAIVDGEITGIGINSRFAGAFIMDVGKYFVMFFEPLVDTEYMAMATAIGSGSAYVFPYDKFEDGFVITVTDASGNPIDIEAVNISIVRA